MNDLQKRVRDLLTKHTELVARGNYVDKQRNKLIHDVKNANDRVLAAPFVQEVLERVQKREHERAVGAYEELLGAFLSDVLPGERFVSMDLYMDRGAPALDIYLQKGQNEPKEDALRGTGGSVANLLSTGLRLIALLRSGARRFLVLDESDCWIEPALIPKYAGVVFEMAETLDVQILMISHHEESLFAGHIPHRLKMLKMGGNLTTEWSPTSEIPQWGDDEKGLRSISLHAFQAHQHTTIPLSPRVTLLQGANDIGKSALVNSLRAVFYGESSDTLIKHHAPSTKVTIDFGPENILIWERFRKGKIKVSSRLIKHDGSVLHSSDGTKIPDWMKDATGISFIDGFDVQIGEQKQPVFLLGEAPSVRAKALAIGLETGHINTMMSLDKSELSEKRSIVKIGEKQLEAWRSENLVLSKVTGNAVLIEGAFAKITDNQDQYNKAIGVLTAWSKQKTKQDAFVPLNPPHAVPEVRSHTAHQLMLDWEEKVERKNALDATILPPEWREPRTKEAELLKRFQKLAKVQSTLQKTSFEAIHLPKEPSRKPFELLLEWERAEDKLNVVRNLSNDLPQLPKAHDLSSFFVWKKLDGDLKELQKIQKKTLDEEKEIKKTLDTLFVDCPACGRAWNKGK